MAWAFIYNDFLEAETGVVEKKNETKRIRSLYGDRIIARQGIFGWKMSATAEKNTKNIRAGGLHFQKKIRCYCFCSVGHWLCNFSCNSCYRVCKVTLND